MRKILLSHGFTTCVDDDDFNELIKFNWIVIKRRYTSYAIRFTKIENKNTLIFMHRQIMKTPIGMETDHIDRDGLNNCKKNLRCCTKSENFGNRISYVNTSSKFKGVCYYPKFKKFMAYIQIRNKQKYLGYFIDEKDAAIAYNNAALVAFGEFARLNTI